MVTQACKPRTDFQVLLAQVDFKTLLEREVPSLRGQFRERYSREVACPFCGGSTRFRYRAPDAKSTYERVFCSHCVPHGLNAIQFTMRMHNLSFTEACAWLFNQPMEVGPAKVFKPESEKPLSYRLAAKMNQYRPDIWRSYFHGRGIPDRLIDLYLLGYNGDRYAIPCMLLNHETGEKEVWGIQYRIRPEVQRS